MKFFLGLSFGFALLYCSYAEVQCGQTNANGQAAGTAQAFIIDGTNAAPGEACWYVSLKITVCSAFLCQTSFCGGSILNQTIVVTAAHCVRSLFEIPFITHKQVEVCTGVLYLNDNSDGKKCYNTTSIRVHPLYNFFPISPILFAANDIAVINVLLDNFQLTENGYGSTCPICPPNPETDYTKSSCFAVGLGIDKSGQLAQTLQKASMHIVDFLQCASAYALQVTQKQLCARGNPTERVCSGDSGGPLYCFNNDNRAELVGIVSFGRQGCPAEDLNVFTRVSQYLGFIEHNNPFN